MDFTGSSRTQDVAILDHVVQQSPVATFAIDSSHRVVSWNRACEKLSGVPAHNVVGTAGHWNAFYSVRRPCLADMVIDGTGKLLGDLYGSAGVATENDGVLRVEQWFDAMAGKRRYLVKTASAIRSADGTIVGAVESVQDVTELKLSCDAEIMREERTHLAQKMGAIGRLAGGIAHDFNNLLTAILGYSRLLKEGLGATHPLLGDLEEIIRAGEKGTDLTKHLLAISRKQVMQPQPLNLAAALADLVPMLRQRAGDKVRLLTECEHELWNVKADLTLLGQVLLQLVANARDAMPDGGNILVRVAAVTADAGFCRGREGLAPGRYVMLLVSDTGCGMSADVQAHLFEPFFTTKDKGRGTGLGLSIVYGIVHQMDGYIEVESGVGLGTRFLIYLPAVDQVTRGPAASGSADVPTGTETVLVVEDEEIVRHLVVIMLKSLGYRVLEASDGREALKIADRYEGTIHMVLTDVVMPHVDGLELVTRLRPIRRDFKVLYTSGFTDGRLLDHGMLEGDYELILKPYTRESLAAKVRHVLDADKR